MLTLDGFIPSHSKPANSQTGGSRNCPPHRPLHTDSDHPTTSAMHRWATTPVPPTAVKLIPGSAPAILPSPHGCEHLLTPPCDATRHGHNPRDHTDAQTDTMAHLCHYPIPRWHHSTRDSRTCIVIASTHRSSAERALADFPASMTAATPTPTPTIATTT